MSEGKKGRRKEAHKEEKNVMAIFLSVVFCFLLQNLKMLGQ